MKTIIFLVIIFLLISWNSNIKKTEKNIDKPNINRYWMLIEFQKFQKEELINKNAFFDMSKYNVATAGMGCNAISTNYKIRSNSEITFHEGIRTKMVCNEMQLENKFLEVLPKLENFKIIGHRLI